MSAHPTRPRLSPEARAYLKAKAASERASEVRRDLPPGSSRAKVTTANARWARQAEERERLERLLSAEDRIAVGLLP